MNADDVDSLATATTADRGPARSAGGLLSFNLRTLLLLIVIVALVAALVRQQRVIGRQDEILAAHNLGRDRGDLDADEFRVLLRELSPRGDMRFYEVVIEVRGDATIHTNSPSSKSSLSSGAPGGALMRYSVNIAANLIRGGADEQQTLAEFVQIRDTHGSSVGGPGIRIIPAKQTIDDAFELFIEPGVYQRGKSIPLCRIGEETTVLTVK